MTVIASCPHLAKNMREEDSATCNFDMASCKFAPDQEPKIKAVEHPINVFETLQ